MPVIELETRISAPIERCFDLARDIDLHVRSAAQTSERAIGVVTGGQIGLGETVTWQARHLGVSQTLTVRITIFARPNHFRDTQVRGAFRRFDHDHFFKSVTGEITIMRDRFDYESPLGWLGKFADALFLKRYLRAFLLERNRMLKLAAELD